MSEYQLELDICERKHGGNAESEEAHASIISSKQKQYQQITELLARRGEKGATVYELHRWLDMRYTAASARCSELKAKKAISPNGDRRATDSGRQAAVLVLSNSFSRRDS